MLGAADYFGVRDVYVTGTGDAYGTLDLNYFEVTNDITLSGTTNSQSRAKVTFHRPLILCSSRGRVLPIKERKKNGRN